MTPKCPICGRRKSRTVYRWVCGPCDQSGAEPKVTDPLLSIRKSRLEAALREAIGWSDQHTDADMDAYVALALAKLEQA